MITLRGFGTGFDKQGTMFPRELSTFFSGNLPRRGILVDFIGNDHFHDTRGWCVGVEFRKPGGLKMIKGFAGGDVVD